MSCHPGPCHFDPDSLEFILKQSLAQSAQFVHSRHSNGHSFLPPVWNSTRTSPPYSCALPVQPAPLQRYLCSRSCMPGDSRTVLDNHPRNCYKFTQSTQHAAGPLAQRAQQSFVLGRHTRSQSPKSTIRRPDKPVKRRAGTYALQRLYLRRYGPLRP